MKKLKSLTLVLAFVLALVGCTQDGNDGASSADENAEDWGITLSATDVTPTGLTIVCMQDEGAVKGELSTGSYFSISKQENGDWVDIDYTTKEEVSWTAMAWSVPLNDRVEWTVGWEQIYGALPQGDYRISKSIMNIIESENHEEQTYYATFKID